MQEVQLMNTITNTFLIIFMFFTVAASAQKKQVNKMLWKVAGKLPPASGQENALGLAGAVSGISNGALIVAGGNNFPDSMPWLNGRKKYYDEVYVFNKVNDSLVLSTERWKLPLPLAYAAVCPAPEGLVYAGGENENGISNKAGLLVWDAATGNVINRHLPALPLAITNASAAAHDHIVYVAGGETMNGVSDHLYALDLTDTIAGWKQMPFIPKPLSHTLAVIQTNGQHYCLYLIGGRRKNKNGISDLSAAVFAFDLMTHQWKQKKSLPYHLSAGTGIAGGHHHILLFGGDKGIVFHQAEMLMAAIGREKGTAKKQALTRQKIQVQASHPGFSNKILLYNTITNTCTVQGTIPFEAPVTTNAFLWGDDIIIPGGEIKAGVRTANILMGRYIQ